MPARRSIYMISIQSEKCRSRQMHEDINSQVQERIVYSAIFQISSANHFATVLSIKISQMHCVFNIILINQLIIES